MIEVNNKLLKIFKDRTYVLRKLLRIAYSKGFINEKNFLEYLYYLYERKRIDLSYENYQTLELFNEKLQWLKLYDQNPLYSILADKVAVKDWVKSKIGEEFVIPTIGIFKNEKEIDFDTLPQKFVVKCNHNSGLGMYICKDKTKFNKNKILRDLNKGLKEKFYKRNAELVYKNIEPKIIVEKLIETENGEDLKDYKFFCFNGEPKYIEVDSDRFTTHKRDFYNEKWEKLDLAICYPPTNQLNTPPENFSKMLTLASILSKDIPFVRVDFYNTRGKIYFGEMTFFHGGGFEKFSSQSWEKQFGSHIDIEHLVKIKK